MYLIIDGGWVEFSNLLFSNCSVGRDRVAQLYDKESKVIMDVRVNKMIEITEIKPEKIKNY